ncbi:hypothetical protein BDW42DRAFT_159608 [Aspergillus taichungensis]|uniref:Uncharacterized protein n=1 Tax=Aspergillus taichungensis TaxID=482145 RepID=A0A2J5I7C6_9EURO|nr:hypothetical protein BDW42DRAFT_159608 [Aspergillus taichungensis]
MDSCAHAEQGTELVSLLVGSGTIVGAGGSGTGVLGMRDAEWLAYGFGLVVSWVLSW